MPLRLLLVDDDRSEQVLLQHAIHLSGADIHLSFIENSSLLTSQLEQCTKEEAPDLILLDIHMPKKDGFACLEELKGMPALRHIPVIMHSTTDMSSSVRLAYSLGAARFACKTPDLDQMRDLIIKIYELDRDTLSSPCPYDNFVL